MKKYGILLVALAALLNLACDDEFAPKIPFEEKYFVYTALKGDSTKQILVVARSYDVTNFDPKSNTSAPEIPGCLVEVVQDGITYRFRDTLIDRPDTSRNDKRKVIVFPASVRQLLNNKNSENEGGVNHN